jgi:transposase
MQAVYAAATQPSRVTDDRDGAGERAAFVLEDWHRALGQLDEVEARMVTVLEQLGLLKLATSIPGLSAVGAAAILAETGDPADYDTARCWPKHAGLCPRDNASGRFQGATRTSGRGRPLLRTATWRAIWGLLPHNQVFAARYTHLTTRGHNQLTDGQARAALGAALLRQLSVVCRHQVAWDPAKASREVTTKAA